RQVENSLAPQAKNQPSSAIDHCPPGPNSSPSTADNVEPVLPSNSHPPWNSVLQAFKGGHAGSPQSLWDSEFRPA
ncbi:hypothetical protein A2U01_0102363, partial [Trifolium medium]|nr:hypothetical protein [Trifolium medium]